MNSIKIIKRDGREKSLNSSRIQYAIDSASLEVGKYSENDTLGVDIAEYIEDYLEDNNIKCIGVEEIQDLVIERLKVEDIEVANAYQKYRDTPDMQARIIQVSHMLGGLKPKVIGIVISDLLK